MNAALIIKQETFRGHFFTKTIGCYCSAPKPESILRPRRLIFSPSRALLLLTRIGEQTFPLRCLGNSSGDEPRRLSKARSMHVYEVRHRTDGSGCDLTSQCAPIECNVVAKSENEYR